MTWWMFAFGAAAIWGVHYVLLERVMTIASPITVYLLPTVLSMILVPFFYNTIVEDVKAVMAATYDIKLAMGIIMFTSVIASLGLYKAIAMSNATLASLIEIAYPIFVVIFAYLIFDQNHLAHWTTALGGVLILAGAGLVVYNG